MIKIHIIIIRGTTKNVNRWLIDDNEVCQVRNAHYAIEQDSIHAVCDNCDYFMCFLSN